MKWSLNVFIDHEEKIEVKHTSHWDDFEKEKKRREGGEGGGGGRDDPSKWEERKRASLNQSIGHEPFSHYDIYSNEMREEKGENDERKREKEKTSSWIEIRMKNELILALRIIH